MSTPPEFQPDSRQDYYYELTPQADGDLYDYLSAELGDFHGKSQDYAASAKKLDIRFAPDERLTQEQKIDWLRRVTAYLADDSNETLELTAISYDHAWESWVIHPQLPSTLLVDNKDMSFYPDMFPIGDFDKGFDPDYDLGHI